MVSMLGACLARSGADEWAQQVGALEARLDRAQSQLDSLAVDVKRPRDPSELRSKEGQQAADKALGVDSLRQFMADVRLRFGSEKARVQQVLAKPSAEANADAVATVSRLRVLVEQVEASLIGLSG